MLMYLSECKTSPHWHQKTDLVENININYMSQFARLAVIYLAELAKGTTNSISNPNPDSQLENGVAKTGLYGNEGEDLFFTFEVTQRATYLEINTADGKGDADLYVRFESEPTQFDFDCASEKYDNRES